MKRIYLCGPIQSEPVVYKAHFEAEQERILRAANNNNFEVEIFNPATLDLGANAEWHDYMRACIPELCRSDGVAVLRGFEKSRGAKLEIELAETLRIPIVAIEPPIFNFDSPTLRELSPDLNRYYYEDFAAAFDASCDEDDSELRASIACSIRFLNPTGFEYRGVPW